MANSVTVYFLEMRSPAALKPKTKVEALSVCECKIKQFEFNRFLYQLVGKQWEWTERLTWTEAQWQDYVNQDELRTWVAYQSGAIAGYYELVQEKTNTQIAYFGLAPQFIGQGLGGYLLSRAIQSAWDWQNTQRVWVHTCSLDHPNALQNYEARGLSIYKVETISKDKG